MGDSYLRGSLNAALERIPGVNNLPHLNLSMMEDSIKARGNIDSLAFKELGE
jgi:hypothetical protein